MGRSARRSCRRAPRPARTRRSSCATATRSRYGGKGVLTAVRHVNETLRPELLGIDAGRPGQPRPPADRPRRDAETSRRLGANALLGVSLARGPRRGRVSRAAAVPLPRRRRRPHPAGAAGQHPQRRQARGRLDRLPGVHGRPGRRAHRSARGCAGPRRHSMPSAASSTSAASPRRSATRVATRRASARNEDAIDAVLEAIERAGYTPGEQVAIALDPATTELFGDGALLLAREGRTLSRRGAGRLLGRLGRSLPDREPRGRPRRGRLGRHGRTLTERLGDRLQLVGDDLLVTNTERLARAIEERAANSILVKLNQIGTLTETIEADRDGPAGGLDGGHQPPIGRDRGHHHRRPGGRAERGSDQDRARSAARSGSRSTTGSCASRRSSPTPRCTPERPRLWGGARRVRPRRRRRSALARRRARSRLTARAGDRDLGLAGGGARSIGGLACGGLGSLRRGDLLALRRLARGGALLRRRRRAGLVVEQVRGVDLGHQPALAARRVVRVNDALLGGPIERADRRGDGLGASPSERPSAMSLAAARASSPGCARAG